MILKKSKNGNCFQKPCLTLLHFQKFIKPNINENMKNAEKRTKETGELMNKGSKPMVSDEITSFPPKKGIEAKAYNMIVPLLTMVFMMPINLIYTGWSSVENATSFSNHASEAIGKGSGSSSVLYAVITALLVAMVMYFIQGIMKLKKQLNLPNLIFSQKFKLQKMSLIAKFNIKLQHKYLL